MVLTLKRIFPQDYTPIICDFRSTIREGEILEPLTIGYQSMMYTGR